jgi:hypothetical protein
MAKKKTIKKTANKRKTAKTARRTASRSKFKVDNQNLILLAIALVVVVIAALFVARLTKGKTGSQETAGKTESGIIVPKGIAQCPKSFYEKTGSAYKVDANKYPRAEICQYYKTIKGDKGGLHNLQYNNEVVACRFFKENGETMIGETKYIHLGYEKKACSQGMYKKN